MSVEQYYRHIAGLVDPKELLESEIYRARRDLVNVRENQPWVSAGWLSDADKLIEGLDKIIADLERLLLTNETARMAIEYVENGYVDAA